MQQPKRLIKVRLEKGTEPALGTVVIRRTLIQFIRDFRSGRSPKGVFLHFSAEDKITGEKTVHGKNDRDGSPARLSQKTVDMGDDGSCERGYGIPVLVIEGIFKHVNDNNGRFQRSTCQIEMKICDMLCLSNHMDYVNQLDAGEREHVAQP
jgi:hypothetical protein